MAENSKIEWTDHTFNPWIGCAKISPGCKNCYAEEQMTRKPRWANCWGDPQATERKETSADYWKQPLKWQKQAAQQGTRPKVFCASLADVFEDNPQLIPWRSELFALIDATPNLDWLILTKRPSNIKRLWPFGYYDDQFSWPNIWLGTTIEHQSQMWRLAELMYHPAQKTFVSCEPLIGSVEFDFEQHPTLIPDWLIVGGESGRNARPFPLIGEWVRSLMIQALSVDVPFLFKQWGEWMPYYTVQARHFYSGYGSTDAYSEYPHADEIDGYGAIRVGKKKSGKTLFGNEHLDFPV